MNAVKNHENYLLYNSFEFLFVECVTYAHTLRFDCKFPLELTLTKYEKELWLDPTFFTNLAFITLSTFLPLN